MSILIQDVFSESLKLSENAWPDWDFVTAIRCFHIKFRELSEVFGDATCSISLLGLVGQTCQAKTWQQVNASNPFARKYRGAVMDVQQRMWIFGGLADDYGHGPTVKPACVLWRLLWVRPVGQRASKRGVTFVIAAIWSWGTRSWNDLRYFDTQAMLLFGESCFSKIVVCWVSFKCHHFLLVVVGLSPIGMLIQRVWCVQMGSRVDAFCGVV